MFLILSRAFTFKGGEKDGYAMVPLLDMLNHSSKHSNVQQVYNFDLKGYELRASQNISQGDEITINYGDYQDQQNFFVNYGFVNETQSMKFPFKLSLEQGEALYEQKEKLLRKTSLSRTFKLGVDTADSFGPMLDWLRFIYFEGDLKELANQSQEDALKYEVKIWKRLQDQWTR